MIATAIGLLVVSPPLVVAAYAVLRNTRIGAVPRQGALHSLGLCALAYVALWGAFSLLVSVAG